MPKSISAPTKPWTARAWMFPATLALAAALFLPATEACADDWQMVWHDEFNQDGPPDPANWDYEHGFVRNNELQWYQPENARCTNGLLVIEARPEHKPNPRYRPDSEYWGDRREWIDYTSASLITRGKHEFKYGKFEMRARIDTRLGSWPAFWTLGTDKAGVGWPACGEIDIMEYYRGQIRANICYRYQDEQIWSAQHQPVANLHNIPDWSGKFHIWTMIWDDKNLDLLLDGWRMNHLNLTKADRADEGNPFRKPVYMILNQAIGGTSGGSLAHTPLPIRFEVDWVRVYQRTNQP